MAKFVVRSGEEERTDFMKHFSGLSDLIKVPLQGATTQAATSALGVITGNLYKDPEKEEIHHDLGEVNLPTTQEHVSGYTIGYRRGRTQGLAWGLGLGVLCTFIFFKSIKSK